MAEIRTSVPDSTVVFLQLDLAAFASVVACAAAFLAAEPELHVLVNNAAIMGTSNHARTQDGFELQFGVNYLGHFLLTRQLMPALLAGAGRVVNVSSMGHRAALRGLPLEPSLDAHLQHWTTTTWELYAISKLANILHARELARRNPPPTLAAVVAVHPGVIVTGLYDSFDAGNAVVNAAYRAATAAMRVLCRTTPEQGARSQLFCATMPAVVSGEYYLPVGRRAAAEGWWFERPSPRASDDGLARQLWDWSEAQLRQHGY